MRWSTPSCWLPSMMFRTAGGRSEAVLRHVLWNWMTWKVLLKLRRQLVLLLLKTLLHDRHHARVHWRKPLLCQRIGGNGNVDIGVVICWSGSPLFCFLHNGKLNSWRSRCGWRWCGCWWFQCKRDSSVHTDTKTAHAAANLIIFKPTRFAHCNVFWEESFPGVFTELFGLWKWHFRDVGFACQLIYTMQFGVVKTWHHPFLLD